MRPAGLPAAARLDYSPAIVHINEQRLEGIVRSIVKALLKQGFVHPKVTENDLVRRIQKIFVENLLQEQALEEEAEKMAARLGRQIGGMDQRKIILGIKQRIAKERGFSL